MKIALIGTHGTGKTTLAHEIVCMMKKEGIDTDFIGEVARYCPFPINEDTTKKSQIWMLLTQLTKEIEAEEKCEVLVSDRSVLDYYVYYVSKFGRSNALEPLIKVHMKTYDFILKVPIREGFLKEDKVRSTNRDFQREIDDCFDELLELFNIEYINLKNKITDFNKDKIGEILKGILNGRRIQETYCV